MKKTKQVQLKEKYDSPEELIDAFYPILYKIAKKRSVNCVVDIEDLISVGANAIINAYENFDPSRGVKLSTFLYRVAYNAIFTYWKNHFSSIRYPCNFYKENLNKMILDEKYKLSIDNTNDNDSSFVNIIPGKYNVEKEVILRETKNKIKKIIDNWPEREKYIVENSNLWFGNKTFYEIGLDLLLSKQRVSQIHKKMLNKLKKELRGE